ncbi:MAG: NACHT domain-containing protein [Dysgonamonadaceae bacterium]|jgi:predicted NACHT family NTPase|nr:NACHT domain-containing protein [Dysgonamonadaceae bacterium]
MITELILQEFASRIITSIPKLIKNTDVKSYSKEKDILDSLNQHLTFVKNWSSEVIFFDLKKSKSTKKVFVDLDLYVQPLRVRINKDEIVDKIQLQKLFDNSKERHIALLGQVGSGKTTSLKYFCQSLIFNEGYFDSNLCYPILIKLNDFNNPNREYNHSIIINKIIDILGVKFDFQELDEKSIDSFKEKIVINFLNENNILLLLDGFDELVFQNRKNVILEEFEKLVCHVEFSKIILTSRTSDFRFSFSKISIYEICPLNDEQIEIFALKWLGEDDAKDFVIKVKKSPFYDTTIRPLTIAHLCALYERNKDIPEKPRTVYKKIVNLLLEEWNQQRNVHKKSKYSKFENDRKFEFLSCMAYNLTITNNTNNFLKTDLENIYTKIYKDYDLIREEMIDVINEIESHNGLILESGFQNFEFAHKSIQEYLTAEYIVKLPSIPKERDIILKLPNEMAVAIAISSNPSNYFKEFIDGRFIPYDLDLSFAKPFINRLLLEKVDFNQEFDVATSVLSFYSAYIQRYKEKDVQLVICDDLTNEFEEFVLKIFERNDTKQILDNYSLTATVCSLDNDRKKIHKLTLDKLHHTSLPRTLYCRDTFIRFGRADWIS